ncbi:aminotransferase class V-fold PLP-dependent enzyme [Alphaproteobacteria bacterium]|nr:aminotransferase class V-fold PLP-dependent enzyme [Alphaproteobacteria bacterium]
MSNQHFDGPHFLQLPGPSNVPGRILRAMSAPTIDHRGPEFGRFAKSVLSDVRRVFKTEQPVIIYPSSGTGAWEAALANVLVPGDKVLMFETGHFATLWQKMAERLGLDVIFVEGDWRRGVDPAQVEAMLSEDKTHSIKAVCAVHNETSTGVTSRIGEVRKAIDASGHPALLLVDTISGLGSMDYCHDEWGVDVTVSGSQKGLMLPPGLGFNAISEKAQKAAAKIASKQSYWRWDEMVEMNKTGYFPYTPATNLLFGLREAMDMMFEEGLERIFHRHARLGEASRQAVRAWGLEIQCEEPREYSNVLTAVRLPEGHDADAVRKIILERFNMSLGNGLSKLSGRVFRIGHLGDTNDLMIAGTLSGVEMGLSLAGVPINSGGVTAALDHLKSTPQDM